MLCLVLNVGEIEAIMENNNEKWVLLQETWNITLSELAKGALLDCDIEYQTDETLSEGKSPHPMYRIYVREEDEENARAVLEGGGAYDDAPWDPNSDDLSPYPKQKWYMNRRILRRIFWIAIAIVIIVYGLVML